MQIPNSDLVSYDYTLNNAQLKHVAEEKVLGIIATRRISWEKQINAIVSRADNLL